MFKILKAEKLADKIYLMDVEAPRIARACEPGEFVTARMDKIGERIPPTICDHDRETGATTITFQVVGVSIQRIVELQTGDALQNVVGPFGNPPESVPEGIEVSKNKKMLFVAGGVGTAPVYPQVKQLHEHGIDADVIVGAKNHDPSILEEQTRAVAGNLHITTDDGSYVRKGMVTGVIKDLIQEQGKQYDVCAAVGPMIMMKFVCLLTRELNPPTIMSTSPIMVDGTGMCDVCCLTVGDEMRFVCVGGLEFNGHLVNFDEAVKRQQTYKTQEGRAMSKLQEGGTHHGGYEYCGGDE